MSLALLSVLGTLFLLWSCFVQHRCENFCLVLLYFVFALFDCFVLWACHFLKRDREEVDPGGVKRLGEVGELEGVETVVRIYCMREDSIFNNR